MKKKQFKEGRGNKDLNIDNIKIVFKNKNIIMKKIEEKFEQDDYLNLNKLDSYFKNTLINSYYNYMKRIITDKQAYSNIICLIMQCYIKMISV